MAVKFLNGIDVDGSLNLVTSDIPNLAASKITSGSFGTARIPNLAASKITSGTLGTARIPDLSATYQVAGNYFTDGDTVLNMTNNDGLVYDDATNKMYVKLDGTNREIYHTANLTPLTIGTTSTTAMAGNTSLFDGAYGSLSGTPSTFTPSSHAHNDLYYTEEETRLALANAMGWEASYGGGTASDVQWNLDQDCLELQNDTDTSIGAAYQAVYIKAGQTKRFTVNIKGDVARTAGMYIRLYQHNGNLPNGKTHVSNDASSAFVQEDDSGVTSWHENGAISTDWVTYEKSYTATADGYVSLVILNWTSNGTGALYIRTPDIQTTSNLTAGTNVSISSSGVISSTDTDTVYTHPTTAGNKHVPTGGAAGQFLKYSSSGTATWATPSYTTNTNTTYSIQDGELSQNNFTNADHTKLNGIEAGATADQDLSSYLTAETFTATSVAFTVDGNDIIAGDDLVLAGGLTWTNSTKTLTSADTNTTYSVGDGGLTTKDFTVALKTKLDGIAASATNVTNTNQLTNGAGYLNSSNDRTYITDTRGSQRAPSYYNDRYAQWDFQNKADTLAGGDTWHGILTVSKWSVYDASHRQEQIFFTGDDLKRRTATSETAWGSVKTIWDSGNLTAGTNVAITNGVISSTDTDTVYTHPTSAGNKHIPTGGAAGQFLKYSASGTAVWAAPSYTTNTDTQLSDAYVIGLFSGGTNVTLASDGTISSTDTDTVYTHPTTAGNKHVPTGGSAGQFLKYSASGTATWATPSYTTNTDTNTTYSAGGGLDLTGTTFSIEPDLRDGITRIGKDSNNYIAIDADDNNTIDFFVSGVWVARMEADGDLHMKGDVIAFSDIFNP